MAASVSISSSNPATATVSSTYAYGSSTAFVQFQEGDIVKSTDAVSVPVWTGDRGTLTGPASGFGNNQMTTSSLQVLGLSGEYYLDVYNVTSSLISSSNVQFSIAYADIMGSGSSNYNSEVDGYSPSRTTYGQYRTLILGNTSEFTFNEATSSQYFYALSVDRARFKERIMPGSIRLELSSSKGSLTLVDDSALANTLSVGTNRYYNLIDENSVDARPVSYGWLLPDIGTILLDGQMLSGSGIVAERYSGSSSTGSLSNATTFYDSIKEFTLRSEETIASNYLFVRAKNSEFNYSTNPSFVTSNGTLLNPTMVNFPETYITAIGLYNDSNDLLAVAKLSRPLPKNFTKEALIRVKLNY